MLALQNNYDRKSEGEHRKQVAKDYIKRLFYRNKSTFSFEKYVTTMKQTFNVLENYNVSLHEEDKISKILDNINGPNNDFKTEVNIYRSGHSASSEKNPTYLSTVISHLFLETHTPSIRYGRRRQVNSSGRRGKGVRGGRFEDRRGCGRGSRGGRAG